MSKPVPRSRLNITYRTKIEGRPVKQKLPFRLMVLGDFSGGHPDKLESREVHSILPGMRVDDFMNELAVAAPIEDDHLKSTLIGTLTGTLTGEIKKRNDKTKKVTVKLMGTGVVSGTRDDNGLGNFKGEVVLSGETEVDDKPELSLGKQEIKVAGLVSGDICGRVDTKIEFTFDKPVAIGEEDASGRLVNENKFKTPAAVENDQIPVALSIALHGLKSFSPDYVAANVPELRRLMLIRRLLLEARAYIANRYEMREIIKTLMEEDGHATLKQLQDWGVEKYPMLQIVPQASAKDASGGGGGGGGGGGTGKSTGGGKSSSGKSDKTSASTDKAGGAGS